MYSSFVMCEGAAPGFVPSTCPFRACGVCCAAKAPEAGVLAEASDSVTSIEAWASEQFATLQVPDRRLKGRAVTVLATMARRPADSVPHACDGNWGQVKGAYRLIENERVTARNLQEAVEEAGARACAGRPTVLAVQDTTDLLFKRAYRTEGLGYINGYKTPGLLAHSTLAVGEDAEPGHLGPPRGRTRPEAVA